MPNLIADCSLETTGQPGCYAGRLSPDWAVWGPNGGYLAAYVLRAACLESRFSRPASFHCHFLGVGEFAEVEFRVTKLGGGKRAESLRIDLFQQDRMLLAATVWMVDEGLDGFEHNAAVAPDVPGPDALLSFAEHAGDEYASWYPIWRSIEGKPVEFERDGGIREPRWHCWLRFGETPIPDAQADAMRHLFWLDLPGWNALTRAHPWPPRFLAPNLDLTVQFHRFAPQEDWMLATGYVPVAGDGLVGCVSHLWSSKGQLLATGASKHSCRRNPNYEEQLAELEREQASEG